MTEIGYVKFSHSFTFFEKKMAIITLYCNHVLLTLILLKVKQRHLSVQLCGREWLLECWLKEHKHDSFRTNSLVFARRPVALHLPAPYKMHDLGEPLLFR